MKYRTYDMMKEDEEDKKKKIFDNSTICLYISVSAAKFFKKHTTLLLTVGTWDVFSRSYISESVGVNKSSIKHNIYFLRYQEIGIIFLYLNSSFFFSLIVVKNSISSCYSFCNTVVLLINLTALQSIKTWYIENVLHTLRLLQTIFENS